MSLEEETEASSFQEPTNSEDMIGTDQEMATESMESSSVLTSFPNSQQMAPTTSTKTDNDLKAPLDLPTITNTSLVSPIMIGNVHAASALSSVFHNQELTSSHSRTFLSSASLNSDLISSVIPIFLHSGDLSTISPSTLYTTEPSCASINLEGKTNPDQTTTIDIEVCPEAQSKSENSNILGQTLTKPSLSSSDTIILNSDSSNGSCPTKIRSSEDSLGPGDKKLSLLSYISERSVSLESIPSLTLFRPGVMPGTEPGISSGESSRGVAVIGGDKVPPWLIQLLKGQNNLSVATNDNGCLIINKSNSFEPTNSQGRGTETEESYDLSSSNQDKIQEVVDMTLGATLVKHERLEHSDTLILSADEHVSTKKTTNEHQSGNAQVSFEKTASGLSFASISTLSADPADMVDEQNLQDSLASKHVSETQNSITNLLNSNISQILYPIKVTNDPLGFNLVSTNETNSSSLNQLTIGNIEQSLSQTLGNGSVLVVTPGPRVAEAKETQTDLMLGTNTVYFKAIDNISGNSSCETGQFPTTLLTMTATSSVAQCDPGQTLQPAESQLTLPPDPQIHPAPFMSPSSTAALAQQNIEFIASAALSNISQDMQQNSSSLESNRQDLPWKCAVCSEKFGSKFELVRHKRSHKNFKCDLCNATFSRMGNYTRHRKIHNLHAENQSGFQCDDCGRKFLQRCDLRRHCLIHTREEPYRCDVCNKGYIRRSDLIVHMRFHNKDRAFHCSLCDKKFFQSGDLNRHVRRAHQPDSELTCGHCDRKYACETTLIRHMKAVHKDIILQAVNQKMQDQNSTDKTSEASYKDILFTTKQKQ